MLLWPGVGVLKVHSRELCIVFRATPQKTASPVLGLPLGVVSNRLIKRHKRVNLDDPHVIFCLRHQLSESGGF